MWAYILLIGFALVLILLAVRKLVFPRRVVLQPYQRGVLTSRGVYETTLAPGVYWIPSWKLVTAVDQRLQVLNVAGQEVLSSDGLSIKISIAGEWAVEDAERSLFMSVQPLLSLYSYVQAAVREMASALRFEEIMQDRAAMNLRLLELVQPQAKALGLTVQTLRIRDIMLPADLKRAFSQTLTAQKEGQAALERARGETAALRNLANAAKLMEDSPALLQLRALQAMEAGKENTLVLGVGGAEVAVRPKS